MALTTALEAESAEILAAIGGMVMLLRMNIRQLPEGWAEKKLGDVCEKVEYGSSAKSKPEGKIPVLRMGNIQNGAIDWKDLVYTADQEEIDKYLLKHNDVLFNRTNSDEHVGKAAIYKSERPAIFAGYLIRIHRKEDLIDADFLNYYLNSHTTREYGKSVMSRSVNQANINGTKLKDYPILVPPLSEQKRIVSIVDEAFEGIDLAIANTQKNLTNAHELFESYLNGIFTLKGDGWMEKKLGTLLDTLTDYHANGSYETLKKNVKLLDNDGYAYMVRSTDFENNFTNSLKYIDKHAYEFLSKSKVLGGEIIISKIGNAGKVYLMPQVDEPCSLAMNLFLLRINPGQIRSDYLYYFLESQFGKLQISERLNGTTTKTIRKDGIRSLNVLVAPLSHQKEIVEKLDSIASETQRLEAIYRQKLAALTELKQSILQKAFTGELTADTANQTTKKAEEVIAA